MDYNSFNVKPIIKIDPDDDEKPFTLLNNIAYLSANHNGSDIYRIEIHKGYNWNGANIPRFFWRLIGSQYDPKFAPASMIHDWLTENKSFIMERGAYISSVIFRDILVLYGVPKWKANIMFSAVYAFQLTKKGWN